MLNPWLNLRKVKEKFPIGSVVQRNAPPFDILTVENYQIINPIWIGVSFKENNYLIESSYLKIVKE